MTVKTILAVLTDEDSVATMLHTATALARRHGAHLIGLHVMEALVVHPGVAMHVPGPVYIEFDEAQQERADRLEAAFRAATDGDSFPSEWRLTRSRGALPADHVVAVARGADLVCLPQEAAEHDGAEISRLHEPVIKGAGRPVLVIPRKASDNVPGARVMLGWSDTREATRAAHDAMTLLAADAEVHVMTVARGGLLAEDTTDSARDIAAALDRHGARVTVLERPAEGSGVAEVLMKEAFERGADLIVTGAFGHSRVYDFVLGAATRDLLSKADRPVLFSK